MLSAQTVLCVLGARKRWMGVVIMVSSLRSQGPKKKVSYSPLSRSSRALNSRWALFTRSSRCRIKSVFRPCGYCRFLVVVEFTLGTESRGDVCRGIWGRNNSGNSPSYPHISMIKDFPDYSWVILKKTHSSLLGGLRLPPWGCGHFFLWYGKGFFAKSNNVQKIFEHTFQENTFLLRI